jgi:hypothetical protein
LVFWASRAAGGAPDRVLVERLAVSLEACEAEREQRRERAAQLVLLRQLVGMQPREGGRAG